MNHWKTASMAALLLGGVSVMGLASAQGDAEAGADKIATCVACHGEDGKASAAIYPHLSGQSATYLESSLKAYREGLRNGGMAAVMTPQVTHLSDQDISDIAAYYSQQ